MTAAALMPPLPAITDEELGAFQHACRLVASSPGPAGMVHAQKPEHCEICAPLMRIERVLHAVVGGGAKVMRIVEVYHLGRFPSTAEPRAFFALESAQLAAFDEMKQSAREVGLILPEVRWHLIAQGVWLTSVLDVTYSIHQMKVEP